MCLWFLQEAWQDVQCPLSQVLVSMFDMSTAVLQVLDVQLNCRSVEQQQMTGYQTSAAWPMLVQKEAIWHAQPSRCPLQLQRILSAEALTQLAQKKYSWLVCCKACI